MSIVRLNLTQIRNYEKTWSEQFSSRFIKDYLAIKLKNLNSTKLKVHWPFLRLNLQMYITILWKWYLSMYLLMQGHQTGGSERLSFSDDIRWWVDSRLIPFKVYKFWPSQFFVCLLLSLWCNSRPDTLLRFGGFPCQATLTLMARLRGHLRWH